MFLGIDGGNENAKLCGPYGVARFSSELGEFRERNLIQRFSDEDMVVEYEGKKYFAGTLAKYESRLGGSRKGGSKAHHDAKLRILIAIHRYADDHVYDIIVGQPIGTHTPEEKEKIQNMLIGRHEITINDITKRFLIRSVNIAAEGASAAVADPKQGLFRIIDIGSGTINYATLNDMRYIDLESTTENIGLATVKSNDYGAISRTIANKALDNGWSINDDIYLVGGGAEILLPHLKEEFNKCQLLKPKVKVGNGIQLVNPIYANAAGFYTLAVKKYG